LKPVHQVSNGGADVFGTSSGALWNGWRATVSGWYRGPTRQPIMLTPAISVIAIIADVRRCSVVLGGSAGNFDCCIYLLTSVLTADFVRLRESQRFFAPFFAIRLSVRASIERDTKWNREQAETRESSRYRLQFRQSGCRPLIPKTKRSSEE
jgi:hypothetical protein